MKIRESWTTIEKSLERFEENFHLNAPVGKSEIDAFQEEFSQTLPDDLVESLLIHDGETVHGNSIFPWAFCSLKQMKEINLMQREILGLGQRQTPYVDSVPKGFIRNDIDWSVNWLPVMSSESGEIICDLDPGPNGTLGQVIFCPPIPNGLPREVLAENYPALLAKLSDLANNPNTVVEYGQLNISTLDFEFDG